MKAGWKIVPMGQLCSISSGESDTQDAVEDGQYAFFDRSKTIKRSSRFLYDCEALIIPGEGKEFLPRHFKGKFDLHQRAYALFDFKPELDVRFLYYLLHHRSDYLPSVAVGATVKSLRRRHFEELPVPLPPLAEQKRIVALLDEAFAGIEEAIANAKQKLSDAQSIADSHINSIFTKPGPGWAKNMLYELCTFSSGNTPSKSNSGYWNGTIPWISGRDMKSTRLSDSHLHISKSAVEEYGTRVAEPGTLLVLVRGMGLAHGAQVAELTAPCAFNQDIRGIHANASILPRYLLFALKHGINNGDSVLSSAAHGTLKIDSNELHSLPISYPNLKRQEEIVVSIDDLTAGSQSLAKNLGKQVAALDELRKALLTQAFAGELTA
jgi:type I restriction enzyme S subunit